MSKLHATKTAQLDQLAEFNLHELESRLTELEKYSNHKDPTVKSEISALRQAIHKRQRKIKSEAIEFELTNDHSPKSQAIPYFSMPSRLPIAYIAVIISRMILTVIPVLVKGLFPSKNYPS